MERGLQRRHGVSRQQGPQRHKELTKDLLARVFPEPRPFAVRLWDGELLPAASEPTRATLVLHRPDLLAEMLAPPLDLSAGEAYVRGDFDVEGDLEAVIESLEYVEPKLSPVVQLRVAREVASLKGGTGAGLAGLSASLTGRRHSRERDSLAVRHHYDVSNEFYELWLDRRMVYSCAYFEEGRESLDAAQEAKLELICRKLRLQPGDRLLDIGCGWGALVLYAAERHGVEALGITLSQVQAEEASRRIEAAGLTERVQVELLDYRDVDQRFDKIASVGMAEHVGQERLEAYFERAWEMLEPGGLMLNHAISQGPRHSNGSKSRLISGEFTQRYVFPDGEIVPLWQTLREAEGRGFEVRDVEDLREHYARTLRCWVANLEAQWDTAIRLVGSERARLWRLFMSAAAYQFAFGRLAVHQSLLARPDARGRVPLPSSRAHLYRN